MARHLATIGPLTVWLNDLPEHSRDAVESRNHLTPVKIVNATGRGLTFDESVELARLLVKTAAQHGWGSDEDKERIIAWAQVKKA